ncbi:MAG TPA: ATP-binding protein, partial [Polyangiaceae bacterium LLY-WYZ-15_(1-7)]|nr:ATP-binding protein [Polyangiaceae bacterium LLY-WYZ-15_(1-7)]
MSGAGLWSSLRRTAALVRIEDASGVAAARYAAREVAMRAGVDIDGRERAALVATELASNAWRHAGGGELHVWTDGQGESPGSMGVLAVDRGPGIADVRAALRDGISTAGSLGHGLGAVQRLASWVGIATDAGEGTVVSAELGADPPAPWAALARPWRAPPPTRGEPCGDGWALVEEPSGARSWLVVDGLGHGAKAEEAARAALAVFDRACAAR